MEIKKYLDVASTFRIIEQEYIYMYHENWSDAYKYKFKIVEIKFNNFKIAKNKLNNVLNVLIPLIS